jgi:hypothetical protein
MIFLILQEIKKEIVQFCPGTGKNQAPGLTHQLVCEKYQSWRGSSAKLGQPTFKAYFGLLCSTNFTSNSIVKFLEQLVLFGTQPSSSPGM